MQANISDIELAIEFVSSDGFLDNKAYLNPETGEIYYTGDSIDAEAEALPEDLYENDKYIAIPSKKALNLGKPLVLDFTAEIMPNELDHVYAIFRSRGAYAKFKSLLQKENCTDKWYAYENNAAKVAIIAWCEQHSIQYE